MATAKHPGQWGAGPGIDASSQGCSGCCCLWSRCSGPHVGGSVLTSLANLPRQHWFSQRRALTHSPMPSHPSMLPDPVSPSVETWLGHHGSPALSGVDRRSREASLRLQAARTGQSSPSIPFSLRDLLFGVLGEAPEWKLIMCLCVHWPGKRMSHFLLLSWARNLN